MAQAIKKINRRSKIGWLNTIFLFALVFCSQAFAMPVSYTYDNLNRLVEANYNNGEQIITYAYDAAGNILSRTISSDQPVQQTIVLQPGPGEVKDIWTTSNFSYAPGGGGPGGGLDNDQLRVGGWGDTYLSLIEYDLSGMPQQAISAKLYLFTSVTNNPNVVSMYLDRIIEPWDWDRNERLWWADRPNTEQWSQGTIPAPVQGTWYEIDITDLYNAWQDGSSPNYGLQLRPTTTGNNNFNFFYSSDYLEDPSLRPRLVVDYLSTEPLIDTDGDGVPDITDTDDDNDGIPDNWELQYGLDPLDATDASSDTDSDGRTALQEFLNGTDPNTNEEPPTVIPYPIWTLVLLFFSLIFVVSNKIKLRL